MAKFTLKNVLQVLNLMAESENAMAGLYEAASKTWRNEAKFWQNLAEQERKHAECVSKMIELVSKSPDQFRQGRPFTAEPLNVFLAKIRTAITEVETKTISKSRFVSLALSIEDHVIESNYSQIVITDNAAYKALEKEILSETVNHKAALNSLKGNP